MSTGPFDVGPQVLAVLRVEVSTMQMNTLIRLGSLAFDVAQDEKIRELVGMVHKGGKRRGLWSTGGVSGQSTGGSGGDGSTKVQSSAASSKKEPAKKQELPVPFGPSWTQMPSWTKMPEAQGFPVPATVGKHLTTGNAKKLLKMAGGVGQLLMK